MQGKREKRACDYGPEPTPWVTPPTLRDPNSKHAVFIPGSTVPFYLKNTKHRSDTFAFDARLDKIMKHHPYVFCFGNMKRVSNFYDKDRKFGETMGI